MKFLFKLILSACAIILIAKLLPGVSLLPPHTNALIVAVVLVLLNNIVKPILIFLTFPITLITIGLFLLVINACMILLADKLVDGFAVSSIWTALIFSILLSITQSILYGLLEEDKK